MCIINKKTNNFIGIYMSVRFVLRGNGLVVQECNRLNNNKERVVSPKISSYNFIVKTIINLLHRVLPCFVTRVVEFNLDGKVHYLSQKDLKRWFSESRTNKIEDFDDNFFDSCEKIRNLALEILEGKFPSKKNLSDSTFDIKKKSTHENDGSQDVEKVRGLKKSVSEKITPRIVDKKDVHFTHVTNQTQLKDEYVSLTEKSFIKKMKQEDLKDEFFNVVIEEFSRVSYRSQTTIKTTPTISVPQSAAMEAVARKYYEKYDIEIYIKPIDSLSAFIEDYARTVKKSCYIGVITGSDISGTQRHVTPLLCYFDVEKDAVELIILDSVVNPLYISIIYEELEHLNIKSSVSTQGSIRQADTNSCRTDALIILRNALLWIKHYKIANGFSLIIEKLEKNQQGTNILPPEWMYNAQIYPREYKKDGKYVVIRNLYSSKISKREKIETVDEHRIRNTKENEVEYLIDSYAVNDKLFKDLECPSFIIRKQIDNRYSFVVICLKVPIHDYLVRKSVTWCKEFSN